MTPHAPKPAPPRRPRSPQHSPSMLKLLRQQTGLSWLEFARLVGAPKHLVVRWTKGSPILTARHRDRLAEIARGVRALPTTDPAERRNLILGIVAVVGTFPAPDGNPAITAAQPSHPQPPTHATVHVPGPGPAAGTITVAPQQARYDEAPMRQHRLAAEQAAAHRVAHRVAH